MIKRGFMCVLAFVLVACLLAACSQPAAQAPAPAPEAPAAEAPAAETPAAPADEGKTYKIGVSIVVEGQDFWDSNIKGINAAVADLGGRCEVIIQSAQDDPNVQLQQIENFITQGVDAIICASVDSEAILPAVSKCNAAGIPFIFNYRPVFSTDTATVDYGVGMDLISGAGMLAQWLVDAAKESGSKLEIIELMGALGDNHSIFCRDGFALVADKNPDYITVVTQIPTDWDTAKALSGLETALTANPSANVVYSHSDYFYASITSALQQKGLLAQIGEEPRMMQAIVGGTMDGVNAVEAGFIDVLLNCPTYEVGYQAVLDTVDILDGKIKTDGTTFVEMDGFLLTKDNFAEMAPKTFGVRAQG
jgi:ABC-type sugar transport system substrate-binding protein